MQERELGIAEGAKIKAKNAFYFEIKISLQHNGVLRKNNARDKKKKKKKTNHEIFSEDLNL